jgi:hypothetical protein
MNTTEKRGTRELAGNFFQDQPPSLSFHAKSLDDVLSIERKNCHPVSFFRFVIRRSTWRPSCVRSPTEITLSPCSTNATEENILERCAHLPSSWFSDLCYCMLFLRSNRYLSHAVFAIPTQGVGIHGMEIYFPRFAVKQSELEEYMGAGKGKFTIG